MTFSRDKKREIPLREVAHCRGHGVVTECCGTTHHKTARDSTNEPYLPSSDSISRYGTAPRNTRFAGFDSRPPPCNKGSRLFAGFGQPDGRGGGQSRTRSQNVVKKVCPPNFPKLKRQTLPPDGVRRLLAATGKRLGRGGRARFLQGWRRFDRIRHHRCQPRRHGNGAAVRPRIQPRHRSDHRTGGTANPPDHQPDRGNQPQARDGVATNTDRRVKSLGGPPSCPLTLRAVRPPSP